MSEPDGVGFLAAAPLFEGLQRSDLVEVARVMRRRSTSVGDVLWHQGTEAKGIALIVEGRVSVTLRLPGDRALELTAAGPGETLGELPLIDGGPHSATARVTEAGSLLFLNRADFAALVSRDDPSAFALKRRFAAVTAERLRGRLEDLGDSLGPRDAGGAAADPAPTPGELEFTGPADSEYIRRMATFRAVDALALWGFLTAGRYARCPRGQALEEEGAPAAALYMVINGAVEKVLVRGDRRIRVGLAGPGRAFGYEGLIDGEPSPAHAIARERALLLVLSKDAFARLFDGESDDSLMFLDVINRDLAAWLREAIRPQARLAVRPTT
ncbi:MAG: cyclic nucleotide-binding domain-containing protein [Actinomycetota bacterium]|nr:cyclic nucleotide-binding domain-containing protein [Actinomycetota bacterium]